MKTLSVISLALFTSLSIALAENAPDKALQEGQALAMEICSMGPEKDSSMTATLQIQRDRRTEVSIPIEIKLIKGDKGWKSIYQTRSTNVSDSVILTITHTPGELNSYEVKSGTNQQPQTIAHNSTGVPFAGSDFWISDLGLEFFRWKDQRVTAHEMRNSQACYVLESKNDGSVAGTYSKVISWIDKDTLGIVFAEAYDQNGKLLKIFKPTGFDVKKKQVKTVEMRNRQTKLESRLIFDVKEENE
ncbi:MAG TPA: outer membrane lipoprotein-sorting protein [Verrucomicrobiae bacterium]